MFRSMMTRTAAIAAATAAIAAGAALGLAGPAMAAPTSVAHEAGAGQGPDGAAPDPEQTTAPTAAPSPVPDNTVTPAPTSGAATATTASGTAVTIPLPVTDASSIAVATAPAHGTASPSGTNLTYTPASGFAGTDTFTYTATGTGGTSAPAAISITVAPAAALTVSDSFTTSVVVGQPFPGTITATGGTAPYTYSVVGSLPPGLTLNTTTGAITGEPTVPGDFSFEVAATDSSSPPLSGTTGPINIHIYSNVIVLSPTSVAPGGTVSITGQNIEPGTLYTVVLQPGATILLDHVAVGDVTLPGAVTGLEDVVTVPSSVSPGSYTIQLVKGTAVIASAPLTVTEPASASQPTPTPELAATGGDDGGPVPPGPAALGLLLLLTGSCALTIRRMWTVKSRRRLPDTEKP